MSVSADLTNTILDRAWSKAEAVDVLLQSRLDAAQTAVSGSTSMGVASATPITSITAPSVNIPLEAEGPDLTVFNTFNNAIFEKLVTAFADYLTDQFPMNATTMSQAESWLQNEILNGGSGINPLIEAQIWERDRSRILKDAIRAADETTAFWATKGFPLPPGALQAQMLQIQQTAQDELAKSSREVAIETFKAELEMIKFALGEAIKLRQIAVTSAGDYIKAIASSQNVSYQMAMGKSQAQNGLINAAAAFWNAKANAEDIMFKSRLANASFSQEAMKVSATISAQDRHKRGDVAVAAADATARQAAAMLNNLHTSVGVQGSEKLA